MTSTGGVGTVTEITVHYDIRDLSPNLRLHWRARAKRTKQAREVARLAWIQAGKPTTDAPVRVSMIVRRARQMDQANLWSAAKACLDGVFVKAFTPDDGPKWLTLGEVRQESGKAWKERPEVIFIIQRRAGP
jgi:hypothetical protein